MPRSPYVLAALVSAARPDVEPVGARLREGPSGLDEADVEDREGRHWTVKAPHDAGAGAALEREVALLGALAGAPAASLPFTVPVVAGQVELPEGGRAVVVERLPGQTLDVADLTPHAPLTASLGRALAAVHDLDPEIVADAGAPVYEAREYQDRRLSELDRAAATGLVPSTLLSRWEEGLEDVGSWRFLPAVIHGDLAAENVLASGPGPEAAVSALIGWTDAVVADPADDLAWLAAGTPPDVFAAVLEAYCGARSQAPDENIAARAHLAGELALARWLLHGVATDDPGVVADAARMLRDLETTSVAGRR